MKQRKRWKDPKQARIVLWCKPDTGTNPCDSKRFLRGLFDTWKKDRLMINTMSLALCLFLCGCHLPLLFWEEEARKVMDDIVDEEEHLTPVTK